MTDTPTEMTSAVDQEFLSDPDNGVLGDCWRACIATILGLPGSVVPHFVRDHGDEWLEATEDWLVANGHPRLYYFPTRFPITDLLRPFVILVGPSPRGVAHAVVADADTGEMVHDPHPSRDGLVSRSAVYAFDEFPEDD